MLVLTRKNQEKIRIGDDITITVIKTKGKSVRLGIEAPNDVPVLRGELLHDRPEGSAQEAADPPGTGRGVVGGLLAGERKEPRVQFTRVQRGGENTSRIQSLLPEVLGDPSPLCEMLRGS